MTKVATPLLASSSSLGLGLGLEFFNSKYLFIPFVSSLILALVACLDSSATSWLYQYIKCVCGGGGGGAYGTCHL